MIRKLRAGRESGNSAADEAGRGRLVEPPPMVGRIAATGKSPLTNPCAVCYPFEPDSPQAIGESLRV